MHAVWSWLRELVELDDDITAEDGARALTAAGLEVEGFETLGAEFRGVVIAEVASKRKHPDADKLTLVEVSVGEGETTCVICGAPNVPEAGGRVLWARPGAVLPGGFEIGTKTLKGVESAGMLCSEQELGLGDSHDGIIVLTGEDAEAPLGADAGDALGLRDVVFEIGAPANRPDTFGHLGLARELAALLGGRMRDYKVDLAPVTDADLDTKDLVSVHVEDAAACPRYVARVIDGVRLGPSPLWLQQRLRAVGVRPISNLVDISNYVMFELGQPLHAFDWAKVADQAVTVRRATDGETMRTLDDVERALEPSDLLICDAKGPVALAGVMGGGDSEVSASTTRVLLEAANFEPRGIRRTARRVGLHSESSHRFERGVDPNVCELASARAAQLLARFGGGKVAAGIVDLYPTPAEPRTVAIRASRATALTGIDISQQHAAEAMALLGLASTAQGDDVLQVQCPTSRPDLTREVDLIEEIIRIHGFDKLPATLPLTQSPPTGQGDARPVLARRALTSIGMCEAIMFGFTSPTRIGALRFPEGDVRRTPLTLRNPMSQEQSVMRTSLLANLLGAVQRNLSFGIGDVRLFEVGSVFLPRAGREQELPDEPLHAAGVLCGTRRGWLQPGQRLDFFDAKGAVERLLAELLGAGANVRFKADPDVPHLHPGLCAAVYASDLRIGEVGEVHPTVRTSFEIAQAVFAFELDLSELPQHGPTQMGAIHRHPAITRDVSFFVDAATPASRVRALIHGANEQLLERVNVLEDYRDAERVPAGKKGMLWSVTYRAPDRTLTDKEADKAHEAIVSSLLSELPADRR